MVGKYWTLVGQTPIECSLEEWARFIEDKRHVLKQETVLGYYVSTVFLGADHSFSLDWQSPNHIPELFETMVFQGKNYVAPLGGQDQDEWLELCWRTRSYDEAMQVHESVKEDIQAGRRR